MIALDTNVWARAILGDDPKQSAAARAAIAGAAKGAGIFVPMLVLVELSWVLKSAPGWSATRAKAALGTLMDTEGVEVEASPLAREALARSSPAVGLADHLVALVVRERGCGKLVTLDARLAKTGQAALLKA